MTKVNRDRPQVMGILNVTPDSFYEGARQQTAEAVRHRAEQILVEGGDIIDVGAFSTRPGFEPVSEEEEMRRLDMALGAVREVAPDAVLSVDTFREGVAMRCVRDWGVKIINDISGGDSGMYRTVAKQGAAYVLTHNDSSGLSNTTDGMISWFADRLERLRTLGVSDVWLDPGFGFHKTLEENWALLHGLNCVTDWGDKVKAPVLVGLSRKSMIWKLLDTTPDDALNGTTAAHAIVLMKGAHILRVHDVRQAVETIRIVESAVGS